MILVDWTCGANYMYLCGRPKHPSLIDYLGRWPWSLLPLLLLGTTLIGLCYATVLAHGPLQTAWDRP